MSFQWVFDNAEQLSINRLPTVGSTTARDGLLRRGPAKAGLGRFTLGNIDVFTTWQGTVVYAAVIAFSLLAINRQQQDLALRNSLSLEPVRADVEAITRGPNLASSDEGIAALRPLEQVQKRTPQQWLELVRGALPQSQGRSKPQMETSIVISS